MRIILQAILLLWLPVAAGIAATTPPPETPSTTQPPTQFPVRSINETPDTKAKDDADAIIATTREITEQGPLHRGCDFPTLICHGGKPEICLQEKREQCDMEACIVKHEAKHLEDIAEERIVVCEGRKDGQLAQTPLGKKVLLERSAIKVEQACLQFMLRQSDGECRRRIAERLQRVVRFDRGCVQGAENCKSPLAPFNPDEVVSFCSW